MKCGASGFVLSQEHFGYICSFSLHSYNINRVHRLQQVNNKTIHDLHKTPWLPNLVFSPCPCLHSYSEKLEHSRSLCPNTVTT